MIIYIYGGIWRGEESERSGRVETSCGDDSETGPVMEEESKNQGPVSKPASPRMSGIKRIATFPRLCLFCDLLTMM